MNKIRTNRIKYQRLISFSILIFCFLHEGPLFSQSRITYNNRQLFLSGSNIAWINFARDIGPDATNLTAFQTMFDSVKANHGNALRFWLHTNGQSTPSFDVSGKVNGPGTNAIADLQTILDDAWQRNIGLVLCLWSFDMLQNGNNATINSRNRLMLNDTVYLNAYIDNALIPMVSALKGHPAIIAWEVFNEAEGMSIEYGWTDLTSADIPMANIQRFVNRVAGAIHRTDTSAQVTTGAWAFKVLTDVLPLAKRASTQSILQSLTTEEKARIEDEFTRRYNIRVSADTIISRFNAVVQDQNYYRDDRLIASGGDTLGILDFYTVHYYSWAGIALSPFHHHYTYWQLNKPLIVAEFFLENTFGVFIKDMFRNLYENGYAGALTWDWHTGNEQQTRTKEVMNDLFYYYPDDLDVTQMSGKIYRFVTSTSTIDLGDSTTLEWTTSAGSSTFLDGVPVTIRGTKKVSPSVASEYTLTTTGSVSETSKIKINLFPTGMILYFRTTPKVIAAGDTATLCWRASKGSQVTLNSAPVNILDSLRVSVQSTTFYRLNATGDTSTTSQVVVNIVPVEDLNRALQKPITVYPNDSLSSPLVIVDGNFSTEWTSAPSSSIKIVIDLEKTYNIHRILFSWGQNYAIQYRIVTGVDGISDWKQVMQVLNGTGEQYSHDTLNLVCRYLWIQLDKKYSANSGYDLGEIQVFGTVYTTHISEDAQRTHSPDQFRLFECYPNPFNPSTTISFCVPSEGEATLKIYNLIGSEICTLFHEPAKPGIIYQNIFHGDQLASGIYLSRLSWNGRTLNNKILLLR